MSLSEQSQQWYPTSVQVTVLQARGLRIKGKNGTNDAYATMQVAKDKFSTSVSEKTVAPVWKEEATFDLPLFQAGNAERCSLQVCVMHRALVGLDKTLGMAIINLAELHDNKSRSKTEWFKLLGKNGKADKDRGEVLLDIQFMRNNMTASMFDLSGSEKSRSRLGKLKDKLKGKKKDDLSDSASAIVPSSNQVLTESEGEDEAEATGGKKKNKLKSLFVPKSGLQRNMSQSMSTLPTLPEKDSAISLSRSSGLNVESPEGKKKFKFLKHKRTASSDSKTTGAGSLGLGLTQSNVCINGSHVYTEETRTSQAGSTFSLNSSGHGSMEDVRKGHTRKTSNTSVDSLKTVQLQVPQNAVEEMRKKHQEEEEIRKRLEDEQKRQVEEEEKEEKERRKVEKDKEMKRVEEEKRKVEKQHEEERKQNEEEEERKRLEREEERKAMRREEERRIEKEMEERKRVEEEERKERIRVEQEQTARLKKEQDKKRKKVEEDRLSKEEERLNEERRKRKEEEERVKLHREEEARIEMEKRHKEEQLRKEKIEVEEKRRRKEEEDRLALEEKERKEHEMRRLEKERLDLERKKAEEKTSEELEKRRVQEEKRMKEQAEQEKEDMEKLRKEREQRPEVKPRVLRVNLSKMTPESLPSEDHLSSDEGSTNPFDQSLSRSSKISAVKPSSSVSGFFSQTPMPNTNPFLDDTDAISTSSENDVKVEDGPERSEKKRRAPMPPPMTVKPPRTSNPGSTTPVKPSVQDSSVFALRQEKRPAPLPPENSIDPPKPEPKPKHMTFSSTSQSGEFHLPISENCPNPESLHLISRIEPSLKNSDAQAQREPNTMNIFSSKKSRAPYPPMSGSHDSASKHLEAPLKPARQFTAQDPSKASPAPETVLVKLECGGQGSGQRSLPQARVTPIDLHPTVGQNTKGESASTGDSALKFSRPHAVKPLSASDKLRETPDTATSAKITDAFQVKMKAPETKATGPYSQLTHEELINLLEKQKEQLSHKDRKIMELEQYIDNLLVRVMEEKPSILMTLSAMKKSV